MVRKFVGATRLDVESRVPRLRAQDNMKATQEQRESLVPTRTGADNGSNERNRSPPSAAGQAVFSSNSARRDRLETVRSIPPFGTPCGCCWSTSPGRPVHDQESKRLAV